MNTSKSLNDVFASLGKRLYEYESRRYLADVSYLEIGYESFPYDEMMYALGVAVNEFDAKEVYWEAKSYEQRVMRVLSNLEKKKFDVQINSPVDVNLIPMSSEKQDKFMEEWRDELFFYINELQIIQKAREHYLEPTKSGGLTLHLSPNFSIGEIVDKGFKPHISNKEAGYFLLYLERLKVLPPYQVEDQKRIAELLFCRNGKNVYTEKVKAGYKSKDTLNNLKQMLLDIIAMIEKDQKTAI